MFFLLWCFAVGVLTVPLAGGRLRLLGNARFAHAWLLLLAFGIQATLALWDGPESWWRVAGYLSSYPLGIAFLVLNRRVPGFWLIAAGAALNVVAIAANGGVMPAAPHALAIAGLPIEAGALYTNSAALADPHLLVLGDIFAVPASWPFADVFSIGDLCIAFGAAVAVHGLCGSRLVPGGDGQFRSLLRQRTFVRLWSAQIVSNLGDWIYWLAVSITLSERVNGPAFATALAILLIAQFLPSAVFGALFAGPIVDRYSRRVLMVGADLARAAAVGTLLLVHDPAPAHFYLVAVVLGLFGALFQPSLLASVPNVVGRGQIVTAQAMVGATFHLAVMVGPAIGGLLIGVAAPSTVVGLNAVSFAISAALIAGAAIPRAHGARSSTDSPWRDLKAGMRYIASNRLVRGIILVVGVVFLAAATKAPLEPLFVRDVLAWGGEVAERARVFGLITSAWGLGMLLGSFMSPALARRWPRERLFPGAILLVGLAIVAVSQTGDFSAVLFAWLIAGTANSIGNVSYESLLQERTPDGMRGRVFAATEAVTDVTFLSGALAAGLLGTWLRVTQVFAIAGGLMIGAAALGILLIPSPGGVERRPDQTLPPGRPQESRPVTRKPASRTL